MTDNQELLKIIEEKDRALLFAYQRLETIQMFSGGQWESEMTRKRIEKALGLTDNINRDQLDILSS